MATKPKEQPANPEFEEGFKQGVEAGIDSAMEHAAAPVPSEPYPAYWSPYIEAPVSVNYMAIDPDGFHEQWTMRGDDWMEVQERKSEHQAALLAAGYKPKAVGRQQQDEPPATTGELPFMHDGPSAAPPPFEEDVSYVQDQFSQAPPEQPEESFIAVKLRAETRGGKTYWSVTGPPPLHKFGLRVWEETLEAAGLTPSRLNPGKEYNVNGWKAVVGLDGSGKKAVIKLIAPRQ